MGRYSSIVYTNHTSNSYLAHHGILGQKWGHKNGPPYPLDASDHSASEKKAGWTKSLDRSGESSQIVTKKERPQVSSKTKTILKVAGTAAAVAGVYMAVKYKPEIRAFINLTSSQKVRELRIAKNTAIAKGAKSISEILYGVTDAINESRIEKSPTNLRDEAKKLTKGVIGGAGKAFGTGVAEGGIKGAKAVGIGLGMLGVKELSDIVLGKNTSGKAFKANDKKKIGSFWKYQESSNSDDSD